MQQLFPREGETLPRLRFPEFKTAPEWEEMSLGSVCEFQDGYAFSSSDFVKSGASTMQVIRITDINNRNTNEDKVYVPIPLIRKLNLDDYIVKQGDVLLSLTGAAGFKFFSWDSGEALINQRTIKIVSKEESNHSLVRLLEPLLYKQVNEYGAGQNNNLSKEVLRGIRFRIPKPEEQQRIFGCLSSLDELISEQRQKIEALKTHKKGLMQQLFPSPAEVEA